MSVVHLFKQLSVRITRGTLRTTSHEAHEATKSPMGRPSYSWLVACTVAPSFPSATRACESTSLSLEDEQHIGTKLSKPREHPQIALNGHSLNMSGYLLKYIWLWPNHVLESKGTKCGSEFNPRWWKKHSADQVFQILNNKVRSTRTTATSVCAPKSYSPTFPCNELFPTPQNLMLSQLK